MERAADRDGWRSRRSAIGGASTGSKGAGTARGAFGHALRAVACPFGGAIPRDWTCRSQLAAADCVEITRSDLTVESWSRFSQRQERAVPMAGLVGSLELAGNLEPLLPLFALAQVTHVGKGATLGLGRVQVTA